MNNLKVFFVVLVCVIGLGIFFYFSQLYYFFYQDVIKTENAILRHQIPFSLPNAKENYVSTWGAFGDFIGGTLNPLLTFISICLILYTVYQNKKSLDINSDELKLSREAQQASASAQNEIQKLQSLQYFENTFLSLQKQLKEYEDKICLDFPMINDESESDKNNIENLAYDVFQPSKKNEQFDKDIKARLRKLRFNISFTKFFSIFILILRMIDNRICSNSLLESVEKKRLIQEYIDFLVVNIPNELLQTIVFFCHSSKRNKDLISKFNIIYKSDYRLSVAKNKVYSLNVLYISSFHLYPSNNYDLFCKEGSIVRNIVELNSLICFDDYINKLFLENFNNKYIDLSYKVDEKLLTYRMDFDIPSKIIIILKKSSNQFKKYSFEDLYIRDLGVAIKCGGFYLYLNPFHREILSADRLSKIINLRYEIKENPL